MKNRIQLQSCILQMIGLQHELSAKDLIHPDDLSHEVAGLSKHKKSFIDFVFQQHVLIHAATETIKECFSFHIDDEDEGTESFSACCDRIKLVLPEVIFYPKIIAFNISF